MEQVFNIFDKNSRQGLGWRKSLALVPFLLIALTLILPAAERGSAA